MITEKQLTEIQEIITNLQGALLRHETVKAGAYKVYDPIKNEWMVITVSAKEIEAFKKEIDDAVALLKQKIALIT
jgi:DNA-directed RNA polymerase subunit L